MIKRVTVLRRRDDVDAADAAAHWQTPHADLVNQVPGVTRYAQRICIEGIGDPSDPRLLGIGEVWFETRDQAAAATSTPEWDAVIEDARRFVELPPVAVCWVEE